MSRPADRAAGRSLGRTTWPRVDAIAQALFVVPLGSCEQHGPHLPFDVDTAVAQAVADGLTAVRADVVLGPALPYGASGEHEGFPGTVSIGTETTSAVLLEIGRSASRWARRLLFVSAHGGNGQAIERAVSRLRSEGRDAAWWPCAVPGGDAHAGRTETAMLLALRPGDVRTEEATSGSCGPLATLLPQLEAEGVRAVSSNGVLGDPGGASAEEGHELLAGLTARLAYDVAAWSVRDDGRLRSLVRT
jgi:creatinine amidohydrolase